MFQLWFFHHTPPTTYDQIYPEDKKAFLSMSRYYNEARKREYEEQNNKGKFRPPDREVVSTAHRPGFAKPGTPGAPEGGDPSQPPAQRGIGTIKGPGVHIGRQTSVGKHIKHRRRT
jgi:hypothetical protein